MAEIPLNEVTWDFPDKPKATLAPKEGKAFSEVPLPSAAGTLTYRMRGYDTSLARYVFWWSAMLDAEGDSYTGPGPLADIVLFNLLGS